MQKLIIIVLAPLFLLASCKKNDHHLPVVYALGLNENNLYRTSDTVHLFLTIIDNEQLASRQVEVIDSLNFIDYFQNMAKAWRLTNITSLSGNTVFDTLHLAVPDSAASGNYRIEMKASDDAGHTGQLVYRLKIMSRIDSILPEVEMVSIPDSAMTNQSIPVVIKLSDNLSLAQYQIRCISKQSSEVILDTVLITQGISDSINSNLTMPATAAKYTYEFTVRDRYNNKGQKKYDIVVQ